MVRYILGYAVLLGIVALLLWIGRRYSTGRTNGGSPTRVMPFRKFQKSQGPSSFASLVDLSSRLLTSRRTTTESDSSEVKQALEVLEELYDDFESDMSNVRTDFSLALEALHREMDARMTRLEEHMLTLVKNVHGKAFVPSSEREPELTTINSEGHAAPVSQAGVSLETDAELPRHPQAQQLSPSHLEALRKLEAGHEVEDVAQSLGLGIGEIAILKRLSLESGAGQAE